MTGAFRLCCSLKESGLSDCFCFHSMRALDQGSAWMTWALRKTFVSGINLSWCWRKDPEDRGGARDHIIKNIEILLKKNRDWRFIGQSMNNGEARSLIPERLSQSQIIERRRLAASFASSAEWIIGVTDERECSRITENKPKETERKVRPRVRLENFRYKKSIKSVFWEAYWRKGWDSNSR